MDEYTPSMDFTLTVNVSVERADDSHVSREDLLDQITRAIDGANPTTLRDGDEVTIWDVEEA